MTALQCFAQDVAIRYRIYTSLMGAYFMHYKRSIRVISRTISVRFRT